LTERYKHGGKAGFDTAGLKKHGKGEINSVAETIS